MFKKFVEGLTFGAGFGISFIIIWYTAAYIITPLMINIQTEPGSFESASSINFGSNTSFNKKIEELNRFNDLEPEEQIKAATVIFYATYQPSSDGKMRAIITEIIKKDENVTFHYNVGNEYPHSSYYPEEDTSYGEGIIVILSENPPRERRSYSVYGGRILGLGDMPIEIFKKKFMKNV